MSTIDLKLKTYEQLQFEVMRLNTDNYLKQQELDQYKNNWEELKEYMENFQVIGNGGTDFRPAFEYIQGLIDRKEFVNLKGMIYFTDGYGYYPRKKPPYDTAFVFMEEDYSDVAVPPWAMKLIIEKEALEEETALRLDYELIEQGMKYEY
jgi:predicted metal-dependent peptidase